MSPEEANEYFFRLELSASSDDIYRLLNGVLQKENFVSSSSGSSKTTRCWQADICGIDVTVTGVMASGGYFNITYNISTLEWEIQVRLRNLFDVGKTSDKIMMDQFVDLDRPTFCEGDEETYLRDMIVINLMKDSFPECNDIRAVPKSFA